MEGSAKMNWEKADTYVFWGEIAPADHVVQIYENDDVFLDLLEGFVSTGINGGESVIAIATPVHLSALNDRLKLAGIDVMELSAANKLLLIDAEETLSRFLINGWPDSRLFNDTISEILKRANHKDCNLRVFGELVALLAANGQHTAALHLENLWNRLCKTEAFCLFCAYPKAGFTQDIHSSLHSICSAHSKMVSGEHRSKTKVFYKTVREKAS